MRDAILDTTAPLVGEHGLRSVTTSQIAEIRDQAETSGSPARAGSSET